MFDFGPATICSNCGCRAVYLNRKCIACGKETGAEIMHRIEHLTDYADNETLRAMLNKMADMINEQNVTIEKLAGQVAFIVRDNEERKRAASLPQVERDPRIAKPR